ncbi:hypothetical protein FRB94_009233 [Tulasnella sp. JGI-2019a]|nr:hypothetical protein FRB94_009233 [Tulasnella sp. JGI-2019a]KAG9016490.1 hypothetical protein FRB93_010739 [Tulasnella sp. JGI-2019a]KAG9030567.1 hypothetical protein FRB95_003828 [Tulasnella sp. JGI-2019a]
MPAERVLLSSIKTLNFYAGEKTAARRSSPISQLTCIGKACNLYTPGAVQCFNVGGSGTDVSWKCEADLPSALRFGRVDVSCEGWLSSGDSYVLKGSCGLEYRLVEIPGHLKNSHVQPPTSWTPEGWSYLDIAYSVLWFAVLGVLLYSFLAPCFRGRQRVGGATRPGGGGGTGGGYNNYGNPGSRYQPPPPPYTKDEPTSSSNNTGATGGFNPGFWTGLGLGGAGAYMWNNLRQQQQPQEPLRQRRAWDWERPREPVAEPPQRGRAFNGWADGGGEGSSSSSGLGEMRRATGVGGSSVR